MQKRYRKTKKVSVSAIVPVFNEEKTVKSLINTLLKSPFIDELICINDGSSDRSLEILENFKDKIILINLKKNRGKGNALSLGIKKAKGEIVIFFDADLVNLSNKHIKTLLSPLLKNETEAVLGYLIRKENVPAIFSNLTGQRAYYRKDLLLLLKEMSNSRFGVEVLLNDHFKNKKVIKTPLINLIGLYKYEKYPFRYAFKEYRNAAVEIARELSRKQTLLPEDLKIIENLNKVTNLRDLKDKILAIKNKKIKDYLKKYILKYITEARDFISN